MSAFAPDTLSQAINPWTWWLKASDNTTGFINISNYKSGNPETERQIVQEVAGYGMQLDKVEVLLEVMLDLMSPGKLDPDQQEAVDGFRAMMRKIREKKEKLALDQLSPGGVEQLVDGLAMLKEKHPERYERVAERLKQVL